MIVTHVLCRKFKKCWKTLPKLHTHIIGIILYYCFHIFLTQQHTPVHYLSRTPFLWFTQYSLLRRFHNLLKESLIVKHLHIARLPFLKAWTNVGPYQHYQQHMRTSTFLSPSRHSWPRVFLPPQKDYRRYSLWLMSLERRIYLAMLKMCI